MVKYQIAIVLVLVVLAIFSCEAQRQRGRLVRLSNSRQLARQEAEEPVTPYPSADELKPEIPFDEAVPASGAVDESSVLESGIAPVDEGSETAANEPIPDEVYGPPEIAVLYNTPDEVYGPPEVDANLLPSDVTLARQGQNRLILPRQRAAYRQARLAKLRRAQLKRSA